MRVEISAKRDLKQEVKNQATKAVRISGCLYKLVWNNIYMSAGAKTRIYNITVRLLLTYAAETRAETTPTQQILRTTEMKIIRAFHGKTLKEKIRSEHLQQLQDVVKGTNVRRGEWNSHVNRMEENRLSKITRDNRPPGVRSRGRLKKRWKEKLDALSSP